MLSRGVGSGLNSYFVVDEFFKTASDILPL
jgi:hypothetical protein